MAGTEQARIPGFYKLSQSERVTAVQDIAELDPAVMAALTGAAGLSAEAAEHMIENVVGVFGLPLGIAVNFQINGRDRLIPMAIEEPSVVAGASFMAKLARAGGGFEAESSPAEMIGQVQLLDIDREHLDTAAEAVRSESDRILTAADEVDPVILSLGGGARALEVRPLPDTPSGPMLIVHLIYDTRDAMGANAINTAVERLAPMLEEISGGRAHLRILSNLADHRLARARCRIPQDELAFGEYDGAQVRQGVIDAWAFAAADPYRAATHNKGIMNGIDAVVIATGNDWRAVEAGAHAYAARDGRYTSLSRWWSDFNGDLLGELELPLAVGTVGGATRVHPAAQACLKLMAIESARELAEIIAAVGLAQNLAALRALATEGIQRGHMGLHARQVAIAAGAQGETIDAVARAMVRDGQVRLDRAQALLQEMKST